MHDIILLVVSFSQGNTDLLDYMESSLGVISKDLIKDVSQIFRKYNGVLFKNGLSGIPKQFDDYKSDFISSTKYITKRYKKKAIEAAKADMKKIKDKAMNELINFTTYLSKGTDLDSKTPIFKKLFVQFDEDHSGYIDFNEFVQVCKYMGLTMDKEKSLKLFSMADKNNNNKIDYSEFQDAIALVKAEVLLQTLEKLELTTEDIVWIVVVSILYLLLLFTFIFLGISAFSRVQGFNSAINSLLPFIAGILASLKTLQLAKPVGEIKDIIRSLIRSLKGN